MIFFLSCDAEDDSLISGNNDSNDTGDGGSELIEDCEEICCNGCNLSLEPCEYQYCQDADVCLSLENLNEEEQFFEIRITSNKYVKGFQFSFDNNIIITGFSQGIAQESGLSSSNDDDTIIAFSFSGNSIAPLENQLLGNVYFSSFPEDINSFDLFSATFSDCNGISLDVDYLEFWQDAD